jgi:NAD(P)-dependent dehydrogenase (short-subunit alcohol dehydrogenase family)
MSNSQSSDGRLVGKVAVVTGAGRGIGRAYAHALAAEGAAIVVNDLASPSESPAAAVAAEIIDSGGRATVSEASVADFAETASVMETAVEQFGRLDILIANAGNSHPATITDASADDWASTIAVHVNGTFNCVHHAAPLIAKQGGGTIITTGDITTGLYFPRSAAYRSSKAAIAVLTLYAAHELAEAHINVNSIMPPATDTRMMHTFFESLGDDLDDFMKRPRRAYGGPISEGPSAGSSSAVAPERVPPFGVYLCTDAGRSVTGRLFKLYREAVRLVISEESTSELDPEGDSFSLDELERRVPDWLADAPSAIVGVAG